MKRIGIIAALAGELKPLVEGWQRTSLPDGALYSQTQHGVETVAVYRGMGREAAARACVSALEAGPLAALVSIGWAGALSSGLPSGRAYCVTGVVDAATGERYATESARQESLPLVTARRVVPHTEKRQFAEDFGAKLVDMEAATVARLARARGVPFYCYKAVSDGVDDSLPNMEPFIGRDGQMRMGPFIASVIVRPWHWPALARMGRNSSAGAAALAEAVRNLQRELADADGGQ